MKTTKKNFDAVAESRKWREQTSAMLASMTTEQKVKLLNQRLRRFKPVAHRKAVAA